MCGNFQHYSSSGKHQEGHPPNTGLKAKSSWVPGAPGRQSAMLSCPPLAAAAPRLLRRCHLGAFHVAQLSDVANHRTFQLGLLWSHLSLVPRPCRLAVYSHFPPHGAPIAPSRRQQTPKGGSVTSAF